MNRQHKIAWFGFTVIVTALALSVAAVAVAYFAVGLPMRRAVGGFGFMGLTGLLGLSPLLYKKGQGKVTLDERDHMIQRTAALAAYSIFWFLFVIAAMIPFFILGPQGRISVQYLPVLVLGGGIIVWFVQSIITIEQYGWRKDGHE